jgi:hypothetical protein
VKSNYTGVCDDGPMKGRSVTHDGPYFTAEEPGEPGSEVAVLRHRYDYDEEAQVWVYQGCIGFRADRH